MMILNYRQRLFTTPFYEMYFLDTWNDNKLPGNPLELIELSAHLDIKIDTEFLYSEYERTDYMKGDNYIFYASDRKDIFIYFDLHRDKYDQMAMVLLDVFRVATNRIPDQKRTVRHYSNGTQLER